MIVSLEKLGLVTVTVSVKVVGSGVMMILDKKILCNESQIIRSRF